MVGFFEYLESMAWFEPLLATLVILLLIEAGIARLRDQQLNKRIKELENKLQGKSKE